MPTFSPRHKFADWPNADVPAVAAGVHAVWDQDALIYCGMSGREFERAVTAARPKYGLVTRLSSHASGRLSGDQFCVYVANRLVIPSIRPDELAKFASGELNLDKLTKAYIHERLEYQFALVESSSEAYELERLCRAGSIFGVNLVHDTNLPRPSCLGPRGTVLVRTVPPSWRGRGPEPKSVTAFAQLRA